MMTSKERYLTAVNHREPDMVPIDVSFLDPIHVERILGKTTYGAGAGGGGGGVVATSGIEEEMGLNEMMLRNQKLEIEAKKRMGVDALSVSDYNLFPPGYKPRFINEDTYVDLWARIYRIRRDVRTTWWIDGAIKTPEDLDKWIFPDPDEIDYRIVELTVKEARDDYPVIAWVHGSMMFPYLMRGGIDKLTYDIYRRPEFARKLIRKVADINLEITKHILDIGVDIVAESDDIADCKSPFFNLRIFREFFFPYLKRLIDECHRRGLPFLKHSDGNLYPLLDDFISLGVDGLHPIEPNVMDLADVKRRYGDKFFLRGNVDCTHILPYGSEEDVRRDVRRCIDAAAEGGGFILADSNSMHSNVKTENIFVMIDEGRRYGKYPIRER
jgi:uroporphyrinogen decarboxylase